jgi:GNAT superfamily N-acetyltransferase
VKIPQDIQLRTTYSTKGDGSDGSWVREVHLKIYEAKQPIGTASFNRINAEDALTDGTAVCMTCDYSQHIYDCGAVIFDYQTDDYSPKIEQLYGEVPYNRNLLLIERLEIDPPFRGKGIGLFVLLKLMRRHQKNCGLVAIKPFPLQYEKTDTPKSDQRFKRDHKKLTQYYARLGFKKMPGSDFHVCSLEFKLPTDKQVFETINEIQR